MSTTAHHKLPSGSLSTASHRQLVSYFRSGWAFLIPYLAAYLLYAWLKWPVNPVAAGSSPVDGGQLAVIAIGALPSTVTPSTAHSLLSTGVPCLLHVYWFLHALHLVLGAIALRAWWRESGATVAGATDDSENTANHSATSQPSTVYRSPSTVPLRGHRPPSAMDRLWAAMPWLLLALLFYIPGVYLEWPSDPWEHLRRINEWRVLDTVTAHSTWMKSSYFIPYSLLSWCVGLRQIFWLDFYYTGICLLLCWQYYRLARACDLSERASMVFVLLQALLFGNNIFSFYRYYGISSSIYAQLGAVALTRIVLEAAKHPQLSLRSFFSVPSIVHRQPPALRSSAPSEVGPTVYRPPSSVQPSSAYRSPSSVQPSSAPQPSVYRLLLPVLCILPLIRYNHAQGLGIAALGIGAVIVWRLIEWRRSALWWLIVATLVINMLFLWLYPRPAMVEIHRAQGFLNAWYGFNILNLTSSAGDRMLQIVSVFGLVNLAAALFLIRRNHVIAWLTILPAAVMLLPCIAVPLEQVLAQASGPDNVITFQRFFFSIPPCLALACCLRKLVTQQTDRSIKSVARPWGFFAIATITAGLVSLSPERPNYNRLWNSLSVAPQDLQLSPIFRAAEATAACLHGTSDHRLVATDAVANVFNTISPLLFPFRNRPIGQVMPKSVKQTVALILSSRPTTGSEQVTLTQDPLAADRSAWILIAGYPPNFITGIKDFRASSTALQNPPGQPSEVLTSDLILIDPAKTYCLEMSLKQSTRTLAIAYLGVAWYNIEGSMLIANASQPTGAGWPVGWSNGTLSYFGLIAAVAPSTWTTYRTSFGREATSAIPSNAMFVRIGALLNYNAVPSAALSLTNIRLWSEPDFESVANGTFPDNTRSFIVIPPQMVLFTQASQAAQTSHHWPAQQLPSDLAGTKELKAATLSAGAVPMDYNNFVFVLPASRVRK